jgi:hypothetical protein
LLLSGLELRSTGLNPNQYSFERRVEDGGSANSKLHSASTRATKIIRIQALLLLLLLLDIKMSRGSVVGIATTYWLDDRGVGVRVPVESRIFTFSYHPDDRLCGRVDRVLGYRSGARVRFPALPGRKK